MKTEMSEKIDLLAEALSKAQGSMSAAPKNRDVTVPTKSGGSYSYSFSDLESVWDVCRPHFLEFGLAVVQTTEPTPDGLMLRTMLMHSSGQYISAVLPLLWDHSTMQSQGSAITFGRRYALCSMLGIASATDDDGAEANSSPTSNGNGHARPNSSRNGKPASDRMPMPISGKQLYGWAKDRGENVLKWVEGYGKHHKFPLKMMDWDVDQVADALDGALAKFEDVTSKEAVMAN